LVQLVKRDLIRLGGGRSTMKIVNISEAKTNLSKLVALVYRGEKVVIAKNNLPLVDLVIHKPGEKGNLACWQESSLCRIT